jgi:hypothetical protein
MAILIAEVCVTVCSVLISFELLNDEFSCNMYEFNINTNYISVEHSILSSLITQTWRQSETLDLVLKLSRVEQWYSTYSCITTRRSDK